MKKDVIEIGKLQEFVARREDLKAGGVVPADAWRKAYEEIMEQHGAGDHRPGEDDGSEDLDEGLDEEWGHLCDLAEGKKASHVEIINWVSNNLERELSQIKSVPSPAAASLLKCVREEGSKGVAAFFKDQWLKAFPSTRALEAEARFNDDGRSIEDLIDDFHADDPDKFHFPVMPSGSNRSISSCMS